MARSFNGSSDSINFAAGAPPILQIPDNGVVAISCWAQFPSFGANRTLVARGFSGTTAWILNQTSATEIGFTSYVGFNTGTTATHGFSTNVWRHVYGDYDGSAWNLYFGGVFANSTVDGVYGPRNNGVDFNIGGVNVIGTVQQFHTGDIAEVGIWNAALAAGEIAGLAKGYSPSFVRPANLLTYWPLIGRTSPEIELINGVSGTLSGTSTSSHPRIIMPRRAKVQRYRPVVVANIYVYMRPDADQSDGSWLNELGTNVDLYASVDETVASDADYIQSSTTWGDKVRLRLSDPSSGVAQPFDIRYRASGVSATATLTGRLYQGASTLIDSWSHSVDTTPTNYTHTLGSTEFALISDFTDLFIEFEYNP